MWASTALSYPIHLYHFDVLIQSSPPSAVFGLPFTSILCVLCWKNWGWSGCFLSHGLSTYQYIYPPLLHSQNYIIIQAMQGVSSGRGSKKGYWEKSLILHLFWGIEGVVFLNKSFLEKWIEKGSAVVWFLPSISFIPSYRKSGSLILNLVETAHIDAQPQL
jgi:hypothetical protein